MEKNISNKRSLVRSFFCFPIWTYRLLLSPMLGSCCRFYPSCSLYAIDAIHYFGPIKGIWLTIRRLLRCHPWGPSGVDLILPEKENF
jgi:putative membrane protein insertion efficiency factor